MKNCSVLIALLAGSFSPAAAQPLLTADQAVGLALKTNYDIMVAHNDAAIAKVNNTPGNAGMLPTAAITGADNYALNSVDQQATSSAPVTHATDARSAVFTAGAALNWTLFDGGKMFVTKHKLSEIEELGSIQFKDKVLQTVYAVVAAYYDVVRQKQELVSLNEVLAYNQEQVKILQTSFDAGLTAKTNLLQSQINLNVFKEEAVAQQTVIITAKRTLNQLLGRDAEVAFEVTDSIPLNYTPDKESLAKKLYAANTAILSLEKQISIDQLSVQEIRTLVFPKISLVAGYDESQSNTSVGTLVMSRTYGPQIGGSITIPLYQAGNVTRQLATAKLQLQSTEYDLESTKQQVNIQLRDALDQFENQQQLLQIEKDNSLLAKENLDISMQRLRLGQSTTLEFQQAQSSYVDSMTRLITIEYNLKVAETKLKQLTAEK